MPDSMIVRWDADQQRWEGGPPPGPGSGPAPGWPSLPTVVLACLAILFVTVAFGAHLDASTEDDADPSESFAGASETDECADDGSGDHCDDEEDQGFFGFGDEEDEQDEDPVPDGYELHTDPKGFELHVPEGWRREDEGPPQGVFYSHGGRRHLIQIMEFEGESVSPQEAMDALVSGLRDNPGYSDYGQEELGGDVELNYTYEHDGLGTRDVYMRALVGGDDEVYAVLAAGPESDWELTQERYQEAADSFCVTGHDCP